MARSEVFLLCKLMIIRLGQGPDICADLETLIASYQLAVSIQVNSDLYPKPHPTSLQTAYTVLNIKSLIQHLIWQTILYPVFKNRNECSVFSLCTLNYSESLSILLSVFIFKVIFSPTQQL